MAASCGGVASLLEKLPFCKCVKCHQVKQLKVLSCLHSVCIDCFTTPNKGAFPCPLVQCGTMTKGEGSTNAVSKVLMDLKALRKVKVCSGCQVKGKNTEASHVCLSCSSEPKYMCQECKMMHAWVLEGDSHHKVVTVNEFVENNGRYLPDDNHTFCKVHAREPIKLSCRRCMKLICMVCNAVGECPATDSSSADRRHQCEETARLISRCKQEISNSLTNANAIEKEVMGQMKRARTERESVLAVYKRAKVSVQSRFDIICALLRKELDRVMDSVDGEGAGGGRLTRANTWLQEADDFMKKLNVSYYEGEQALMYAPAAEILGVTKKFKELLQGVPSMFESQADPTLFRMSECDEKDLPGMVTKMLGKITTKRTEQWVTSATFNVGDIVRVRGHVTQSHFGYDIASFQWKADVVRPTTSFVPAFGTKADVVRPTTSFGTSSGGLFGTNSTSSGGLFGSVGTKGTSSGMFGTVGTGVFTFSGSPDLRKDGVVRSTEAYSGKHHTSRVMYSGMKVEVQMGNSGSWAVTDAEIEKKVAPESL